VRGGPLSTSPMQQYRLPNADTTLSPTDSGFTSTRLWLAGTANITAQPGTQTGGVSGDESAPPNGPPRGHGLTQPIAGAPRNRKLRNVRTGAGDDHWARAILRERTRKRVGRMKKTGASVGGESRQNTEAETTQTAKSCAKCLAVGVDVASRSRRRHQLLRVGKSLSAFIGTGTFRCSSGSGNRRY